MFKRILPSSSAAEESASHQPLLNPGDADDLPEDLVDEDAAALMAAGDDDREPGAAVGGKAVVDRVEHATAAAAAAVTAAADPSVRNRRRDAAAELLRKQHGAGSPDGQPLVVSPADDARVLRRIDLVILPLMLGVYFLQALDKATLAYASVFGLIDDVGLVGSQYSWLGSIVYLAQLVMQFPLAWLLVKLPIGKFTSVMVMCWGITLASMCAAHTFPTLLLARFFLGAFEASVAPSFVAITQMWWRRREQTMRVSYWYAMNGITNMVRTRILAVGLKVACRRRLTLESSLAA
jgi:hypothetical protein